jgi:hypothetical protein
MMEMNRLVHSKFAETKLGMWICILALSCCNYELDAGHGATLEAIAADLKMTPQGLSTWLREIGCRSKARPAKKESTSTAAAGTVHVSGWELRAPLKLPGFRKKRQAPKK